MGNIPWYKPTSERRSTTLSMEEEPKFWDYVITVVSVLVFLAFVIGTIYLFIKGMDSGVY